MHRITFWFGVVFLLYISKEIYAFECPDDSDFMCSSENKCIASSKLCDKVKDCIDGSDEEDCDCLAPDWYLCKDNKTCLSKSQVCDGTYDCPIHEDDERNCTASYVPHHETPQCTEDEFTCISDGFCLALEMACDGVEQCMDGSDETVGCSELSKRCKGFLCKNGHCLTDSDWVCDGHNDCGDNSDEPKNCTYNCDLSKEQFLCNDNTTCLPLNKVCNGKADCPKGDDEGSSCPFAKEECNSNACPKEARCDYLPSGSVCICPKGYHFNATSGKCEDVNECSIYGICSQGCFNTQGGYQCICSRKFQLASDNRTCKPISSRDAILVYAASSSVNIMTLNSRHMHRVAYDLNQVVGICYHAGYIYWTDISKQVESVMRSRILGSPETVFSSGLGKPEDITVDHVTGNIYFSDYDHQHIAVCSNDARYCKALITLNVHRPRGVVLHTLNGQIFWSDWGTKPMIGIASMDGKSAKPFISDDIHWPNGLALDWPNDRLYWVDAKLKLIESCKLDGSDRRTVIKHVSKHPYGIAVFEDKLYWSDWNSKSIQSCNKFTGKNRTTVVRDKVIYDIHIYHSAMKGFRENPCEQASCTHLCLLNSNATYTCECPKYWELSSDAHTCIATEKRKILLLGMGNRFVLMEHQAFGRHNDAGDGKIVQFNIDKMAYNSLKGNVLVADNKDKVIYEVDPKTFVSRKLLTDNIENITAMAFDNFANTLYWTDAERGTIEVYSFNTQHRAIVHHYMGGQRPIGLAIVPEKGKLYVTLRSKKHTYIDMMPSNGRGAHYHMLKDEMGEGPVNMLPDHNLEEIFMTDHEHSAIKYMSFTGDTYHTFLHDVDTPLSLAVIGDELFWSTSKSLVLNWTPTHSMTGTKSMVINHPKTLPVPDVMVLQTITTVKMSKHPCVAHNNGCSHLCVAMGANIPSCLCPNGMVFNDSSNTTCIDTRECFFRCGSGECISEAEHCNYKNDCADHSDEVNCPKKKILNCSPHDFICADDSKCIDRSSRCDKKIDCNDESDEADCDKYDRNSKCHERQFMCYDGTCIAQERLCDGFKDCTQKEDELKDNCETYGTCAPGEFKCDNGQCIMDSWVCDEAVDCNDASDERHCTFTVECATDFRKCNNGSCLHEKLWCDGNNDCGDLSDEQNCTLKGIAKETKENTLKCHDPKKFQCKSDHLICLDDSQLCNGKAECPNGEDEANCHECTSDQFICERNECIAMKMRCDNHKDCKNGKDEMDCDENVVTNTLHDEKDVSKPMGDILMIFALVILTIIVTCTVLKLGIILYHKYQANAAANLIVHFKNGTADITTMTLLNTSDDTIKLLP